MNRSNPSVRLAARPRVGLFSGLILLVGLLAVDVAPAAGLAATNTAAAIPWNEIGAKAGANYQGDGLAVTPTGSGARLRCVFQRLDGEATPEGLWLTSTVANTVSDRFRVMAMAVSRTTINVAFNSPSLESNIPLAGEGEVTVGGRTVRFSRPGLTEQYSVSMDGVRQDFIVEQAPPSLSRGELVVKLAVAGAQAEPAADGARLVLAHSGRKIAYSRLRVTDAIGRELPARIEVCPTEDDATSFNGSDLFDSNVEESSPLAPAPASGTLAVVVNDAGAVYPVRIDPTFSDANWVSMGGFPGANGPVAAAVTDDSGNLYVSGAFTLVGNTFATNIAEWNGTSWSPLGSGISVGEGFCEVYALAVSGGTLYAGGLFTAAGGIAATNIAEWNGTNWSALGSGISGVVFALASSGSTLYAGGNFNTAGSNPVNCIAQWNGTNWSPLGSGVSHVVFALAVSGSTLYAGGNFTSAGGIAADNIAQWNGSSWSPLGSGIGSGMNDSDYVVSALAVSGGTLYAGGAFPSAGGAAANCIAQWNGTNWSALGSGMNNSVSALAVSGSTLYAGGDATSYISEWNGTNWSGLGSGMNGTVSALAMSGATLYAGGTFTSAGRTVANYVAQWDGTNWSPLGSGIPGEAFALAAGGGKVYASSYITPPGQFAYSTVSEWNGTNWSALGLGMNDIVSALVVSGTTLYAGGSFTSAGHSTANHTAQWDGTNWSALGSGLNGPVSALAVSGSTLYAGGDFTTADGSAANYIAQWNGSSWSPLGSGMNGTVSALMVAGDTLYAGGDFTAAGGSAASYIAQWDGTNWSALGSGMNDTVNALVVSGSTLYAGGNFTMAGTNISAFAALACLPGSIAIITTNTDFGFTGGVFGFDVVGPFGASVVIQASTDLQTWIPLQTNLLGSRPLYFSDPQSTANVQRFYRAQLSP
jgi:hypothetical protein